MRKSRAFLTEILMSVTVFFVAANTQTDANSITATAIQESINHTSTTTATPVSEQEKAIQSIFSQINMLRAEKKAPMLIFDKNLSMAAQNFAAYLLKIGKLTEEGPKRETVQTRAIDVGYGGGAPFSVSQNVAMIWVDTTPEYLIHSIWKSDPKSIQKLLDMKGQHIGIGVADERNRRFVVVMVGYLLDGSIQYTPLPTYDFRTPKPIVSTTPSPIPLMTATRQPDGSVVHEITSGQTLSEIAYAYKVDWNTIAVLNHLDLENPVIYEGKELIIEPTYTITPTPTITDTPRPPTRTPRPTYTINFNPSPSLEQPTPEETKIGFSTVLNQMESYRQTIGLTLILLSVLGLVFTFIRK
ncbi:LysM peptidoglycan-binding domain-containing protein [Flexilinea flocculi]|jgi:uncharacterized protein YkwD|uniref:Uncharacterized conserved protein YkwD, contains CAP (CSP/antigen 5/PR1) domain n=1 Tax=Flexilinea flocculi TaxID=1678840 RepID=A0A0K8P9Q8_9CHLR|nr:LysM peptidoglycan-binding domain-containing protein [Flexilinea flocculi]GAP39234.1 uncharacterized conserved protein YkwD, contains CAP (CSP/antigen 5/PR1) domain [Flexilinea flocculi]